MAELRVYDNVDDVREQVRLRYAAAATVASGCGGAGAAIIRAAKPASCCEPAAQADCCAPEAKQIC